MSLKLQVYVLMLWPIIGIVKEMLFHMIGIDESTQGTIEEQMLYNRKTLREIIELRYADVKRKVSL